MTEREQMNLILGNVETVNHPIVTHSQPKILRSLKSVMCERLQPQSHVINLLIYLPLDGGRQRREIAVEIGIRDLGRGFHDCA